MPKRVGFFELQSPLDLLNKMEADFRRLTDDPIDVYAAFDFFVTAHHLPEWLGKVRSSAGAARGDSYGLALRKICRQLATGAKHLDIKDSTSVTGTSVLTPSILGVMRLGMTRLGDPTGDLLIHLARSEAQALGRTTISAVELAGMVIMYWKQHKAIVRAAKALGFPNDIL